MGAPNAFSAHLEKWLYERVKDSIVFLNIIPKPDQLAEIEELMESAGHIEGSQRAALLNGDGHCGTGFVIEEGPDHLKILTCAHIIHHVFSSRKPISRYDCNRVFTTRVICDHYESSFRSSGQNTHPERVYAEGRVIGISCRDDLMLIEVPRTVVMDLDEICLRNHPALTFSSIHPVPFDECAMISWSMLRHRTAVTGRVSQALRSFPDLAEHNPVGYRISLLEVNIASEHGSSGAPLVNGNGKVIAMLHGCFGGPFSYFISLNDIIYFLAHQGVSIRED